MSFLSINCLNLSLLSCRDTNWSPPPGQTFTRNPEPPSLTPWLAATPYTCYCCCCCCWWCGEWWCSCRRGWQIRSSAPLKSVHRLVPFRRNKVTCPTFLFYKGRNYYIFIRDTMMVFLNTLKTASTLHILNTGVSTRRGSLLRGVGSNVRLPTRWPCDWILCLSRGFGGGGVDYLNYLLF